MFTLIQLDFRWDFQGLYVQPEHSIQKWKCMHAECLTIAGHSLLTPEISYVIVMCVLKKAVENALAVEYTP